MCEVTFVASRIRIGDAETLAKETQFARLPRSTKTLGPKGPDFAIHGYCATPPSGRSAGTSERQEKGVTCAVVRPRFSQIPTACKWLGDAIDCACMSIHRRQPKWTWVNA